MRDLDKPRFNNDLIIRLKSIFTSSYITTQYKRVKSDPKIMISLLSPIQLFPDIHHTNLKMILNANFFKFNSDISISKAFTQLGIEKNSHTPFNNILSSGCENTIYNSIFCYPPVSRVFNTYSF